MDESPSGDSVIEAYTVLHGREGPEKALITAIMADGRRALTSSVDFSLIENMLEEEFIGKDMFFKPNGEFVIKS